MRAGKGALTLEDLDRASNAKAAGIAQPGQPYRSSGSSGWTMTALASALNSHQVDEKTAYELALQSGFNGTFRDFLTEKDRIIHQSGWNHGGGWTTYDQYIGAPYTSPNRPGQPLLPNQPPTNLPPLTPFGDNRETLVFQDSDLAYLPETMRVYADTLLRRLGYVPTGVVGQYGFKEYKRRPDLANLPTFEEAVTYAAGNDPRAAEWLRWFYWKKGLTSESAPNPLTGKVE